MKLLQSKWLLAFACFALGAVAVLGAQHFLLARSDRIEQSTLPLRLPGAKGMGSLLDQFYDDDFFGREHDPFEQMRKMRKRMMEDFAGPDDGGGIFDSWYKRRFGGGDAGEVTKREDSDFVYYDIAVKDLAQEKLNVKVENGQITIAGKIEKKAESDGGGSFFSSTFHRSFPAPPDVDANKVQMEPSPDKLTLKFPKVH